MSLPPKPTAHDLAVWALCEGYESPDCIEAMQALLEYFVLELRQRENIELDAEVAEIERDLKITDNWHKPYANRIAI